MSSLRSLPVFAWLLIGLLAGGCSTVHDVTVDAISDRSKPLGKSYHLEVNDPTGGVEPAQHAMATQCIKDALAARGLYEVPASVRPDMVVEASYNVGHGHINIVTDHNATTLLGPSLIPPPNSKAVVVYDKTLELTGRVPPTPGSNKPGAELWSVKTKIVDTKQQIDLYLDALASSCIDYIGANPGRELIFPVDARHARELLQRRPTTQAAP